jgi:FkbM family methyltransferase
MSDGSRIRCRVRDCGDWISVYVHDDYAIQIPWPELRSIVDIGACVGSFTVWAGRMAPNARLVAVEPNPDVIPYLDDNIRGNQLQGRTTILECALGSSPGLASLEDSQALATNMRVVSVEVGRGPTVPQVTLEGLFDQTEITQCDLLKLDCEGGEYDVLLTAPEAVLERVRAIVCEYHPVNRHTPAQLIARLTASGFVVDADRTPTGMIRAVRVQ